MKKIFIILPLLAIAACSKKEVRLESKNQDSNIPPEQARSNVPHYKNLMGFIYNDSSKGEFSIGVMPGTNEKANEKGSCKVSTKYEGTEKKVDYYTFALEIKKNDSEPNIILYLLHIKVKKLLFGAMMLVK